MAKLTALVALVVSSTVHSAFIGPPGVPGVIWGAGTKLSFGFNGLGSPADDVDADDKKSEKKISGRGLMQLITAGMGAPFLGDYQGVDDVRRAFICSAF